MILKHHRFQVRIARLSLPTPLSLRGRALITKPSAKSVIAIPTKGLIASFPRFPLVLTERHHEHPNTAASGRC